MSLPLREIVPLLESYKSHIFYPNHSEPFTGNVPFHKWRATDNYVKHHDNLMILRAISKSPKDIHEKLQAEKEIKIAEKKKDYWRRHPNYNHEEATRREAEINKQWADSQNRKK